MNPCRTGLQPVRYSGHANKTEPRAIARANSRRLDSSRAILCQSTLLG